MNKELPVEMTDEDYVNFMIWHRGLAVPAARNLDDETVQRGHKLFREIGCATCIVRHGLQETIIIPIRTDTSKMVTAVCHAIHTKLSGHIQIWFNTAWK